MILFLELIYIILCDLPFNISVIISSIFLDILISFIPKKWIKNTIYILIMIIFICYYEYYNVFNIQLSLNNIINGTKAAPFVSLLIEKMNILKTSIFLLPIIVLFIKPKIKLNNKNKMIILSILLVIFYGIIFIDREGIYNKYNLYFKINNTEESVKSFGLLVSIKLDIFKSIFKTEEKNISKIDFSEICNDDEICEISKYLSTQEVTSKNDYTGIFKDKNLIIFMAESFYPIGIDKEITPTLYKLVNEGFYFENYYTPLYPVSTSDSQYMADTSLIPADNTWSMTDIVGNDLLYSYPKVFPNYKSYSYHNYKYDYYKRNEYMKTLGYEVYLGCGNGLENKMNCDLFQNSDLEMVKGTIEDYIKEDKFLVYYTTMSGHANYDDTSPMVIKNKEKVENLKYSKKVKNYIATQVELNNALEYLIERLEETNKLKDTVILLYGDHYPYSLTLDEINEASTYKRDNVFEKHHSNLVIYNSEISYTKISKYSSTIDILPTMLNLFGVEYDSRLLMGKDIFSETEELVIFSNRSFMYNDSKYNSTLERVIEGTLTEEEVLKKLDEIYLKNRYSRLILENNYYKYISIN